MVAHAWVADAADLPFSDRQGFAAASAPAAANAIKSPSPRSESTTKVMLASCCCRRFRERIIDRGHGAMSQVTWSCDRRTAGRVARLPGRRYGFRTSLFAGSTADATVH